MQCSETIFTAVIFYVVGVVFALWARELNDVQILIEERLPLPDFLLLGAIMKKPWYVKLVRGIGLALIGFGLLILRWHLGHC